MTASGMALLAPIPSPRVRMEFSGPAIRALILIIVGFLGDPQQHTGLTRVTTKPRALIAGYSLALCCRLNWPIMMPAQSLTCTECEA